MNLPRSISVSHERGNKNVIFSRSTSVTCDKSFRNFNVPRSISVKRDRSSDKCLFHSFY